MALFYAVHAQSSVFSVDAQGKGAGGAGLDFNFAADEFDGDGFQAFPDLAVVQGEAIAANPTRGAGFEARLIFPITVERRQAEAFEAAAFALRGDGGGGSGDDLLGGFALGGDNHVGFEVADEGGVDHADLVGREARKASASVVIGGHDDFKPREVVSADHGQAEH